MEGSNMDTVVAKPRFYLNWCSRYLQKHAVSCLLRGQDGTKVKSDRGKEEHQLVLVDVKVEP